jgi:DNA modification methylase
MSKKDIPVAKAKGRPMLTWVGKKPLARVTAFPAQHIETVPAPAGDVPLAAIDWSDWPRDLPQGGLLYHGDNKEVLAHLLANGLRGKVKLIYIDPPFDSGADYVRKVQLRGPKGGTKVEGEDYTLGEQVQYSDIWANDNYLQFMYERLLLLRELLSEEGSIVLHCDWGKSHLLRCVADEVFGSDHFRNEIVWRYAKYQMRGTSRFVSNHDTLFWYSAGTDPTYNLVTEALDEPKLLKRKKWDSETAKIVNVRDQDGNLIYDEYHESKVDDVWDIDIIGATSGERSGYPTQKPLPLLERVISALSNPGDIVLDGFMGSGTTVVAAQKLSRRWIGCDINKGAIQTTAKRLQGVIAEQQKSALAGRQGELVADENAPPLPAQLAFTTWRVNDYDLQIQHNEAVELACEHLGIARRRTDPFFDGEQGQRLAKIVPFNHPLTPLDLEAIRTELKSRPEEERDILVVSLGIEHAARDWLAHYNQNRPINKLHLVELRSDRKSGGFIKHEPLSAQVAVRRDGDKLAVEIADVVSPSILLRLNKEAGVFRAEIPDWRAVVDCVLIDADHDGEIFKVALADVPERKQDFVSGRYELPAPRRGATVAVKIIDMLGEELVLAFSPDTETMQ